MFAMAALPQWKPRRSAHECKRLPRSQNTLRELGKANYRRSDTREISANHFPNLFPAISRVNSNRRKAMGRKKRRKAKAVGSGI